MIEIREIRENELSQAAEVIRRGFGTVAEEFGLTKENCPTNGAFLETERLAADRRNGNFMAGAFSDGRMIGFLQLENKGGGQFELEKITVLPDCRHCGYGKTLLAFAREKAKALGASVLSIGIIEENTRLKSWYTANGFTHRGTRKFECLPFTVGFMDIEFN